MWTVMMAAMMLPSAAPMLLAFDRIQRHRRTSGQTAAPLAFFATGYLVVWTGWSLAAAGLQWGLQSTLLLSPHLALQSSLLAGGVLIAAGLYQWTRLKTACLVHCQSPLSFFLTRWREGGAGALAMGFRHGAYCVGCCWALMGLLFVVGVMNLVWVAGLSAYVLLEKAGVVGATISRVVGLALVGWGLGLALAA
jgi:predicted metal-binding membrane protein